MELGRERAQQSRVAAGVSSLMYRDVQVGGWTGVCAGEAMELGRERVQQSRAATGISSLMYRDVQWVGGRVCVQERPWSWGGRGPSRAGWPPASPASCIEMCRWVCVCVCVWYACISDGGAV